jgi:hypothetical protein
MKATAGPTTAGHGQRRRNAPPVGTWPKSERRFENRTEVIRIVAIQAANVAPIHRLAAALFLKKYQCVTPTTIVIAIPPRMT